MKNYSNSILTLFVLVVMNSFVYSQSYLGLDGGFEGSATIDNSNVQTAAQANKWTKANATQTISDEVTTVRSGSHSLKATNTSTTGRRIWSPLISVSSTTSAVTIQYYRRVTNTTNTQQNQEGVIRATESLQGTYDVPGAVDTWEKQTYSPNSATFTSIAGILMIRQTGTGGDVYFDDIAVYAGAADVTAPNAPTSPLVSNATATTLDLSWTAASGGVDNGGYLVVRKIGSTPSTSPNVNGIYAVSNTIASGEVVAYVGTSTSFTDNGLSNLETYYYSIYTYDKAYNYSAAVTTSGDAPLPVELTSFSATAIRRGVELAWKTATEVNNSGFEVEKNVNGTWSKLGFVAGAGNSNASKSYSFTDANAKGTVSYRLKQIDNNGAFKYSSVVEATVVLTAEDFELAQNFPNPFNPTTNITFAMKNAEQVNVTVYNALGQAVETIFNGVAEPNQLYTLSFDGKNLSSGIYFYALRSASRNEVKKMLLTK